MTPLRAITQYVNDASCTTPAKRGLKIDSGIYCRNVISGRSLFRLVLNVPIGIAEEPIYTYTMCLNYFEIFFRFMQNILHVFLLIRSSFKSLSYFFERYYCYVRRSCISYSFLSYVFCVVHTPLTLYYAGW